MQYRRINIINKITIIILPMALLLCIAMSPYLGWLYIAYILPEEEFNKRIFSYINTEVERFHRYSDSPQKQNNKVFSGIDLPIRKMYLEENHVIYEVFRKGQLLVLKRVDTSKDPFCNEYDICSRINHPNLLKIVGMHKTIQKTENSFKEILWIYSEKLDVDVDFKADSGIDESQIRYIIRDVSLGLKYLHDRNIAHLDVKMQNIMGKITAKGVQYKLIDFGYSKDLTECPNREWITKTMAFGTYPYKPSEVWHDCTHTLSADIYCLGMTAWILALNETPFQTDCEFCDMIDYSNFLDKNIMHFPRNISRNLLDFITKCVKKDRHKRLTIDEVLNHPFITGGSVE